MPSIRIFEFASDYSSLNLVSEIDDYESLQFARGWTEAGEFTIKINWNKPHAQEFIRNRVILLGIDNTKAGIILEVNKSFNEGGKGSETVIAKGKEIKHLLSRRIVVPPAGFERYEINDVAETVMKTLVTDQCGSGATASRVFAMLNVVGDQSRGGAYLLSSRYTKTVADDLAACSLATGVGWLLNFNTSTNKFDFDIGVGVDRRTTQNTNPWAVFSKDYDSARSAEFVSSEISYKNLVYVGGQGQGADRLVLQAYTSAEPTDIDRRELWVDARELDNENDLTDKATAALTQNSFTEYVDGQTLAYCPIQYQRDYNLGDLVTLKAFGETTHARIVKVTETWEALKYEIGLEFDRSYPTLPKVMQTGYESVRATLNAQESDGLGGFTGFITGLTLSNGTDANNDIDIAIGRCRDSADSTFMTLASTLTKQLDAAWAAGTNAGGLFSGTKANSTWYHVFLIRNPTTGVVDGGYSTSATAADRNAAYTQYRLLGAIYCDSGGNIKGFNQIGDLFNWKVIVSDKSWGSIGSTSRQLLTVICPPFSIGKFEIMDQLNVAGSSFYWVLSSNVTDYAPSSENNAMQTNSSYTHVYTSPIYVDTNRQIAFRGANANIFLAIRNTGFEHSRGRW